MDTADQKDQGRLFCVTGVMSTASRQPIGQRSPARAPKLMSQSQTDSSGYVSSSSIESSMEDKRLKLNEQKVLQVWAKLNQQMQGPKSSTPKSTARRCLQRPASLGDISAIDFSDENTSKRVVTKSLSDGDLSKASRVRSYDQRVPTKAEFTSIERKYSTSSSRSCGSGQSEYTDYSSLPRQRAPYDGRLSDDDEFSLGKQIGRSCDCIYDKGVSVDESMTEFLSKVNKDNLKSLLNFYDRVTAEDKRRKQKNYEAVYY